MKKILSLGLALVLVGALAGCGTLIPKKVEFFQKKVKAVPEKTASDLETERQAAYAASLAARLTVDAAVANNDPVSVVTPAKNTEALTVAVSTSLGPPQSIPSGAVTNLANKVIENKAELDRKIARYSDKTAPLVGKKIEGTGLIRVPYFVYIGILVVIALVVWTGLKIYGAVNPVVGLGTNVVGRVGSATLSGAVSELSKGGELFKDKVVNSEFTQETKAKILDWFSHAHAQAQDKSTQDIVKALTVKPTQS
jgi:hypothetical protein